jgi:hypothetical protein
MTLARIKAGGVMNSIEIETFSIGPFSIRCGAFCFQVTMVPGRQSTHWAPASQAGSKANCSAVSFSTIFSRASSPT